MAVLASPGFTLGPSPRACYHGPMPTLSTPKLLIAAEKARAASQFKAARRLFERAAAKAQDPLAAAQAWQGVADCGRLLGDLSPSLRAYARALRLVPRQDRAWQADLLSGQALAWRACGQPRRALQGLRKAALRYQALRDPAGQRFCHWALGGTLRIAGDLDGALKHLQAAERGYARSGDGEGAAYVDCALGGVQRMRGRFAESARHYARANALMRARRDTFGTAYSYCGLGNAARMRGDLSTALRWFLKAEKAYARIGDKVSYAYTLWSLATAHKLMERYPAALARLAKAERLFKGTGDGRGLAYVQTARAEIRALQGRSAAASAALKKAARLARPFAWEARHVRALQALLAGRLDKAQAAYAGSASRFRPQGLPVNWP
jgi:tetratricopeptide (TPR) repeat protein